MFNTIVVPLDGSDLAEAALPAAEALKEKFNSRVILVRAVTSLAHLMAQQSALYETPSGAAASVELIEGVVEAEKNEVNEYFDELTTRNPWLADAERLVGEGEAHELIASTADEHAPSVIVMSSHGRGGLGRLVYGSVADVVLRESHVPVLLIRSRDHEEEEGK